MPITFSCDCGKQFTVADEFAGKRTRCPACKSALIVPEPEPEPATTTEPPAEQEELSDEEKAFRALEEAPDPEPRAAPVHRERAMPPTNSRQSFPPPPTQPPPRRGPRYETDDRSDDRPPRRLLPAITVTPAVAGGCLSMVVAVVWFTLGLAAGWIYIYPPIMFCFGLVAFVRGLLGRSED